MENTKEQVVAEWKAVNEPRLKEIKSANPDLYSAINLALNYLNKKLTGEELPVEVEEEVEVVETQPTSEGFWRVMTEKELIDKYGSIGKVPSYNSYMNWMFGKRVKDLIVSDLSEDEIGEKLNSGVSIYTKEELDPDGRGEWQLFNDFVVFDTSATQEEDYVALTEIEIITNNNNVKPVDVYGISWDLYNTDIAGKKLSELTKDEDDFKKQFNDLKKGLNANVLKFSIPPKFWKLVNQQSQTQQGFKVGDKVKIPTQKSLTMFEIAKDPKVNIGYSVQIKQAIEANKPYLVINEIMDRDYTNNKGQKVTVKTYVVDGDFFAYEDLVPYEEESILEKVKRMYPIGTVANNSNVIDRIVPDFTIDTTNFREYFDVDFNSNVVSITLKSSATWTLYIEKDNKFADIILPVQQTSITTTPTTQPAPAKQTAQWTAKDLVGRTIVYTKNGDEWEVVELKRNNPRSKSYTIKKLNSGLQQNYVFQDYSLEKLFTEGKSQKWSLVQQPTTTQLYTLNVETDPAQVEYNIGFKENKGDRNSPSQGAGDLKFVYGNMPDAYNTIFNTKFKGNDGEWYKIHVGKTGTWTWRKAK